MRGQKRQSEDKPCQCPYCNGQTKEPLPFCQVCGAEITRCPRCGKVLPQGQARCPECGTQIAR